MKALVPFLLAVMAALPAAAQAVPQVAAVPAETASDATPAPAWGPVDATSGVTLEEYRYLRRPVVVFADDPANPQFVQQMRLLTANPAVLDERDVIVITDTDPAARSAVRQKLRPRGFSLVLMDKDGSVVLRKPAPWDLREVTAAIDKFPLRRQEMLERRPAGR